MIHTDMFGEILIEITLDQAGILMLGQATAAAGTGTLDSILNSTNYGFLGDIATVNGGAVASEAAQFVLSNINFNIVRMDMPSYWYEDLANLFIHPANPPGADQAVFAHTMMAPASSWEEEA